MSCYNSSPAPDRPEEQLANATAKMVTNLNDVLIDKPRTGNNSP
jgi:hypothetical protein